MRLPVRSMMIGSASVMAIMGATPAMADTTPASVEKPSASSEVVVTARRRVELARDVPITLTAVNQQTLADKGVHSDQDLTKVAPGVSVLGFSRDATDFYIRGQGPGIQETGTRSAPGVATYFDEVPATLPGTSAFFDLSNIQVLKGPQGTLFGRNTTGGAVLFETARPTQYFDGYVEGSFGNYGYKQLEYMLNVPLIEDKLAVRVAGQVSRRRGFTQSIDTGQWLDGRDYEAVRATILYTPNGSVESETVGDYYYRNNSGNSEVLAAVNPNVPLGAIPVPNTGYNSLLGLPPAGTQLPLTLGGGGVSIGCVEGIAPATSCPAGGQLGALIVAGQTGGAYYLAPASQFNAAMATQQAIGPRRTQVPFWTNYKEQNWGVLNRTNVQVTDDIAIKNIISFREERTNSSLDYSGTDLPILGSLTTPGQAWQQGYNTFTEELQVQGNLSKAHLRYIVGGFYENDSPGFQQEVSGYALGTDEARYPDEHSSTKAVFAHVEWTPIKIFSLAGGIRQTWDKASSSMSLYSGLPGDLGPCQFDTCPVAFATSSQALTYDITASVKPTRDVMAYLSYRRGYKGGNINLPAPPGGNIIAPEKVDSLELGVKGKVNIGIPTNFEIAAFHDNYIDRQGDINSSYPSSSGAPISYLEIYNIPKSINQGLEGRVTFTPAPRFNITATASYLDSHSESTIPGVIYAGRQLAYQPKYTYGISGSYVAPVAGGTEGNLRFATDYSWLSARNTEDVVSPLLPYYPGYGIWNARIEWSSVMGKNVDLSLFMTNITNKVYMIGGYPVDIMGFAAVSYGEPRMFGGSIKIHFGKK